jgi:hypothetical protein
MEIQKVYVRHDGTTVVKCHNCGTTKTVDAAKLKCSCQAVFQVFFEFRSAYRKKSSLDGYYAKHSIKKEWIKVRINNISMTGVGFITLNRNYLRKDDRLVVRISLDDSEKSKIEKSAVVECVQDRYIGCRFIELDEYDKILGFYLMP